jgi:hypothetical protein
MTVPNTILARADALMQRRRHTTPEGEDIPVLTDAVLADEELPVLLDAISSEDAVAGDRPGFDAEAPAAESTETSSEEAAIGASIDMATRELIVREIARRVEERLAAELPGIIEGVVSEFLAGHGAAPPQALDD